ncbi:hypothetical protein ALC56_02315 [Trachymyrmex septentrionalis]|uniref:CCHC-type domain-containing protein n=1 Tax=Trachymyrmex septentrionalis TaxID=34720 RepID=A0A151K0P2_9HYME|nr:hypothetical protein ALC56_02315 [Trachymyrmex septentrionalis]
MTRPANYHVRRDCTNSADRSGTCYRCGGTGHLAGSCTEPASCPARKERGLPARRRIGDPSSREEKKRWWPSAAAPHVVGLRLAGSSYPRPRHRQRRRARAR